jgi:glycosyltransferase involved in cell wall biosynthesis
MKLVSVLLPCFNSELYIGEAIRSILDQTYTNFELLLLDDGSTDKTKSVIQGFKDSRIKLFCEAQNKGIVFQLNKGLELAQGEYIARMDADDIAFPERFQKQVDFLEDPKNCKIDVLGTDAVSIGLTKKPIIHQNYLPKQISFMLNFKCPILHPTVMMRKRIFNKGYKYEEEYLYAEDFALWRKLDNGKNIAILDQVLLKYRIHQSQTNADKKRLEIQYLSALKTLRFRNNNSMFTLLNYFFLIKHQDCEKYLDLWLEKNKNYHFSNGIFIYIKLLKKLLNIKSHYLHKLLLINDGIK